MQLIFQIYSVVRFEKVFQHKTFEWLQLCSLYLHVVHSRRIPHCREMRKLFFFLSLQFWLYSCVSQLLIHKFPSFRLSYFSMKIRKRTRKWDAMPWDLVWVLGAYTTGSVTNIYGRSSIVNWTNHIKCKIISSLKRICKIKIDWSSSAFLVVNSFSNGFIQFNWNMKN